MFEDSESNFENSFHIENLISDFVENSNENYNDYFYNDQESYNMHNSKFINGYILDCISVSSKVNIFDKLYINIPPILSSLDYEKTIKLLVFNFIQEEKKIKSIITKNINSIGKLYFIKIFR